MQILLFVEPHPIRNSFTMFELVVKEFAALVTRAKASSTQPAVTIDFKIYANRQTISLVKDVPDIQPYLLHPTSAEQAIFEGYFKDWSSVGMQEWCELLLGTGRITTHYIRLLEDIYTRYQFDCIIHWGDNGAIKAFADDHSCTRIAMELGCTRAPYTDTVTFDVLGANGSAITGNATFEDLHKAVKGTAWPAGADLLMHSDPTNISAYELMFDSLDFPSKDRLLRRKDQRAVFVPLQLHDDANLLIYSDFDRPIDVVRSVATEYADNGFLCVFKPHPSTKKRPGGDIAYTEAKVEAAKYGDRAIWLDLEGPAIANQILYSLCDYITTVNSSVGFESLFHDKILAVMGRASYKPAGIFPSISDICSESYDEETYRKKIGVLRRFFLSSYLVPHQQAFQPEAFLSRISSLMSISLAAKNVPALMVKQIYDEFAGNTFDYGALPEISGSVKSQGL